MNEVAKVRIGAVWVEFESRPPGATIIKMVTENGERSEALFGLVGSAPRYSFNSGAVDCVLKYQREA